MYLKARYFNSDSVLSGGAAAATSGSRQTRCSASSSPRRTRHRLRQGHGKYPRSEITCNHLFDVIVTSSAPVIPQFEKLCSDPVRLNRG